MECELHESIRIECKLHENIRTRISEHCSVDFKSFEDKDTIKHNFRLKLKKTLIILSLRRNSPYAYEKNESIAKPEN